MTTTDISAFCARANVQASPPFVKTLKDASLTKNGNACLPSGYASSLTAICYDEIMDAWDSITSRIAQGLNAATRIDGLFVVGNEYYFVEFKRMKMHQLKHLAVKLHRKIYDSLIHLVQHGLKTFATCRSDVTYLVVATGIPRLTAADIDTGRHRGLTGAQRAVMQQRLFNSIPGCLARPWRYPQVRAHFGLSRLDDVLYKKALTLTPRQFNLFAKESGWQ